MTNGYKQMGHWKKYVQDLKKLRIARKRLLLS